MEICIWQGFCGDANEMGKPWFCCRIAVVFFQTSESSLEMKAIKTHSNFDLCVLLFCCGSTLRRDARQRVAVCSQAWPTDGISDQKVLFGHSSTSCTEPWSIAIQTLWSNAQFLVYPLAFSLLIHPNLNITLHVSTASRNTATKLWFLIVMIWNLVMVMIAKRATTTARVC